MKTANELYLEFEAATNAFLDKVAALSQSEINTVPFEGSWTAAQVTDHLCKSDAAMIQTLNGPVQPTNRQPDKMVDNLRNVFLDFSTKLDAPEFIIPSEGPLDKDSLLTSFKAGRSALGKAIKALDLTATCHMPLLSNPTRLELISFVIFHTQRHTNQVTRICEKLVAMS
ncbi:DinB family protein [Longitalea luteola]|uniref:DinB family protein n=1 Tax=Longitalea luteola TaxID=2812563 RepID=UPI001A961833|nr:DinB family protein [Longitalea luteola]